MGERGRGRLVCCEPWLLLLLLRLRGGMVFDVVLFRPRGLLSGTSYCSGSNGLLRDSNKTCRASVPFEGEAVGWIG
ncbi:hypothetical protein F5X96DRAFT_641702 [Biscogniauxia mediterranea]|nr:hypothetical protein F5X96DRAFT_641702 [Biscogniauxia mediterranea]